MKKTIPLSIRIPKPLYEALHRACDRSVNPYAPAKTQIVVRGIELSLKELAKKESAR